MNIETCVLLRQVWDLLRFELLDDGYAHLDGDWARQMKNVCSHYSRLYYIAGGEGWVEFGGERMMLSAGNVYLVPAGLTFSAGCPENMEQLYFHINARAGDGYDLFSRCGRVLSLPGGDVKTLAGAYLSGSLLQSALFKGRVEADLWRFIESGGLETALMERHSTFLEQVFAVVRTNLKSTLTIGDVAGMLSMAESTLTKRFRQEFGIPLGRYIDEMLHQEICRRLTATTMPIGEIAEQLGFCDQFYLTRFFKGHQGETPSSYRAHLRSAI